MRYIAALQSRRTHFQGRFHVALGKTEIDELVSLERGEIDRRIYSDPRIFELEMQRIFARSWLFLCHESQIPEPGDFFQSVMGRDDVLVVRQRDGSIKAMLNTCAHRGNAVCRAEKATPRIFVHLPRLVIRDRWPSQWSSGFQNLL